ncbi:MAG: YgjV family protein [Pseudomonadota bacterium]
MSDWLSFEQILGYIASFIILAGYAIKSDKKTKLILIFSSSLFALHFYLLGAFIAMAICLVNAARNGTSIIYHGSKKNFSSVCLHLYIQRICDLQSLGRSITPYGSAFNLFWYVFIGCSVVFRLYRDEKEK